MRALAGVGVAKIVHPFCISRHQAILDAVVDHLDEVARASRAAMQISVFCSTGITFLAGSPLRTLPPGRNAPKNRGQGFYDLFLSTDHQTEAAFLPEHPAAGATIDVMYAPGLERLRSQELVPVIAGVAA